MKVNTAASQKSPEKIAKKELSEQDVQKKLEAKFGQKIGPPKEDKVEVGKKAKALAEGDTKVLDKEEAEIGDIGKNDPKSEVTQEKLKALLRTGAFSFNDKEKNALQDILKP